MASMSYLEKLGYIEKFTDEMEKMKDFTVQGVGSLSSNQEIIDKKIDDLEERYNEWFCGLYKILKGFKLHLKILFAVLSVNIIFTTVNFIIMIYLIISKGGI